MKSPTERHQHLKTVRSDIKRIWSVDEDRVPRLRFPPGVRYGFISDVFVEAMMMQLAVDGALESARWKKLKDLYHSRVGGVKRRMLERRSGHDDLMAYCHHPRCRETQNEGLLRRDRRQLG